MANGQINLTIAERRTGNGLASAANDVGILNKQLSVSRRSVSDLSRAAGVLGGTFGQVFKLVLGGGMWTLAATALTKVVELMKKHNELVKDARLAAQGLSREYMTLEAAARGYQRRVEKWRAAKAAADKAEADAAKAAADAEEKSRRNALMLIESAKEYNALQVQIASVKRKMAVLDADEVTQAKAMAAELKDQAELRVRLAQRDVESARVRGSLAEQTNAEKAVELARVRLEAAVKEGEKIVRDAEKKMAEEAAAAAKKLEDEKAKLAAEAEKKRRDAEKKAAGERIDAIRKEHKAKMDALEEEIRKAHDEAQVLEQNAQRARGGKTFGVWAREERDRERDQRRADIRQQNVIRNAQRELSRLEGNARRGRAFTNAHDLARMAKLREFIADQDPNNNPALKRAQELEKQRKEAEAKMQKDIDAIRKAIEDKVAL